LHHDKKKRIWIGSSIPAGEGEHAYFEGRSKKHIDNSKSLDGMVKYKFCRRYPVAGLKNLEKQMGILSSLESIVEWHLIRRKWQHSALLMTTIVHGNFQKLQFDAVAYLYEICYDIMLIATEHNVSESLGFEGLGLRNDTGENAVNLIMYASIERAIESCARLPLLPLLLGLHQIRLPLGPVVQYKYVKC